MKMIKIHTRRDIIPVIKKISHIVRAPNEFIFVRTTFQTCVGYLLFLEAV